MYVLAFAAAGQQYEAVVSRGRAIDPETKLDAIRDIGTRDGKMVSISEAPLEGRTVINARGLVVSSGFIDLHQHGQTPENYAFKARDGVTTALEMEVGVSPVDSWYRAREGKSLINFGATVGHIPARMAVRHDSGTFLPPHRAVDSTATPEQLTATLDLLRQGLDARRARHRHGHDLHPRHLAR